MRSTSEKTVRPKRSEVIDGYTIKYHANGKTVWSKGRIHGGNPDGYWEWYRPDGTLNARVPLIMECLWGHGQRMTHTVRYIK